MVKKNVMSAQKTRTAVNTIKKNTGIAIKRIDRKRSTQKVKKIRYGYNDRQSDLDKCLLRTDGKIVVNDCSFGISETRRLQTRSRSQRWPAVT